MSPSFGKQTGKQLRDARSASESKQLGWATVEALIQAAYERQYEIDHAGVFEPVHQPPKSRKLSVPRKRNEFIDALAEACGGKPEFLTPMAVRCIAVAWANIKAVSPDCTVEEIKMRVAKYRRMHPQWECTATSVAKHWDQLGNAFTRTELAARDPYTQPANWQERAAMAYPDLDFTGRAWSDLGILTRTEILKRTS